jgi:hypothetical protein
MSNAFDGIKQKFFKYWIFLFPVAIALFSIFLLVIYSKKFTDFNTYLRNVLSFREAAAWGQLGDFMGGILNPFISLFTLIIAVMVWRLQKEELLATRVILDKSIDVAKDQANIMKVQRIEQTMFYLIDYLRQSIKEFSLSKHFNQPGYGILVGLDAVRHFESEFAKFDPQYDSKSQWFQKLNNGYSVKNYDVLALGVKELLGFIHRSSANEVSRKTWYEMSIALLGNKTFDLAFHWAEEFKDQTLIANLDELKASHSLPNA